MVTGANEVVQTNWQIVDITRKLSCVRQIACRESECFSVLKVESYFLIVDRRLHLAPRTMSKSSTCGYHGAPRGVFGRW